MPPSINRDVNGIVRTTAPEHRAAPASAPVYLLMAAGVVIPLVLAYGFATGNDWQEITAILMTVAGLLILTRPVVGMYCFVGLLYMRPEESVPAIAGMHLTLVVAIVSLVGMVIKFLLNRTPLVKSPINFMIIGFGLAATLPAVTESTFGGTIEDIGRLVVLVLLVVNLVRTPRHYGALVTAVIGFTAYLAAYALYLDHTGAVITENGYTRILATGIFSDPNDLAATICAGLALTFSRLTTSASTKRFLYSAMAALMLYAIWLTNSRSGLLALGAVALGFLWQLYRTKPRVAIALAVLMLVAFLAVGHGRMTNYDTSDQSANQRFWYWSNGVQLLMASPFFGCGYGQFINMNGGMVAHNSFVQCFAELGYVGYFFWLGLFYYAFKKPASEPAAAPGIVSPPLPNSLPRDHYAVCLGLAAYLVASYWLTHTYNPVLLLLAGLAVCGRTVSDSGAVDWRITPKELRRDVLAIGTIAVVSVAFIARMADYYR